MDAGTETQIPKPRDGRAQLAALALAIAEQVDERQERYAAVADESDDEFGSADERGTRRARWIVAALVVMAAIGGGSWLLLPHHAPARHPKVASAAPAHPQPASPAAALGLAAGKRLGQGGRPVSVFGCQAAYKTDAAVSPGVLAAGDTSSPAYLDYLHACLSGMS